MELEISNEELGIGDGVGFIMNFICEVTGRYADDYYIVFSMLCRTFIMYVIRRGAHCVKSNIGNSREERKVTVCGYGDE